MVKAKIKQDLIESPGRFLCREALHETFRGQISSVFSENKLESNADVSKGVNYKHAGMTLTIIKSNIYC